MKNFSLTSNLDLLSIFPCCSGSRDSLLPWPLCPRMLAGSLPAPPPRSARQGLPIQQNLGFGLPKEQNLGLGPNLWGKTWGLAPPVGQNLGLLPPSKASAPRTRGSAPLPPRWPCWRPRSARGPAVPLGASFGEPSSPSPGHCRPQAHPRGEHRCL